MKIIAIDDNKFTLDALKELLADEEVITVTGEIEGIQNIKDDSFDIALIDVSSVGNYEGLETISKVHELKPDLKIIAMSNTSDQKLKRMIMHNGAIAYVDKPFDEKKFTKTITKVSEMQNDNIDLDEILDEV